MSLLLQVIAVLICILMMLSLFKRMKLGKLSEEQALFWLIGDVGLLILSCFPQILTGVANLLGIWWPPATLIFFLLIIMFLIIFHHTMVVTRMEAEIKELAMQVALIKEEKDKLEHKVEEMKGENK